MNILKIALVVSTTLYSTLASASLIVTNNGFVDTSNHLEWLSPNKVTSLSDYETYVDAGWQVATISDIYRITTNFTTYNMHYAPLISRYLTHSKSLQTTLAMIANALFFAVAVGFTM